MDSIFSNISGLLASVCTVFGFLIAMKECFRELQDRRAYKKQKANAKLAEQIIAYYCEEQESIKWICELKPELSAKTVREELRTRAKSNDKNLLNTRPEMYPSQVRDFLVD